MENLISRRQLLSCFRNGLGFAAVSPLLSLLTSSCRPKNGDEAQIAALENWTPCPGQDHLNDQEKSIRASLKYVDQTSIAHRTCDNCKLYTLPSQSTCGACKVVPGPIQPKGYCVAWLARM